MRKTRIVSLLVLVAMLAAALSGCTGGTPAGTATTAPAGTAATATAAPSTGDPAAPVDTAPVAYDYDADGFYTQQVAMITTPTNWNPHAYKTADDGDAFDYISVPLYGFVYNEDMTGYVIAPQMAAEEPVDVTAEYVGEKWGIAEGETGKAFRIALNPDACWQDGTPINADTYMYSMKALLDPDLQNYRASDYYQSSLAIHNAKAFVYAGQSAWQENGDGDGVATYELADWVKGEDGQYATADGAKLYFTLNTPLPWMGGNSIADYYGAGYFAQSYDGMAAVADEEGYLPVNDETLDLLFAFTGTPDWGNETRDQLALYAMYKVEYPVIDFADVGIQKIDDYTIDLVLDKELIGFYIKYNLNVNWIVYEPLYEACKVQDATGAWSSSYGTSVDTTISYGPYKLTKYLLDQAIEWERNENWYGFSPEWADTYGTFTRGIDGAECQQYMCDKVVWTMAADISTREEMFLKGQLDSLGLNAELLGKYSSSDSLYFTEGESTYYGIINSDYPMLLAAENVLNGSDADTDPDKTATPYKYNKTILAVKEFRQALCYAIDRTALCAALYPAGTAAFSLFSNAVMADPENSVPINSMDSVKAAVCDFWGVTYGEGGEFADVDSAYEAITGYDIDAARVLIDEAVDIAIANGWMTEESIVRLTYCAASASETETKWYNFFNANFEELMKGTKLEGKFQYDTDFTLGNAFGDKIRNGQCDTAWGFGWSGGTLDPYDLFQVYVDSGINPDGYQYDKWVDWTQVDLELTLDIPGEGAQTMTYNVCQWWEIINGVDNMEAGLPNWAFGKMADSVRSEVLAQIEKQILLNYTSIPLMNQGSVQLKSYKINFGQEEYIYALGRGGLRYMTFNYTDDDWNAYCASQPDGILTY